MGVPDEQKGKVLSALKADIIANGGHLDTGIFGTQFFFEVLSDNNMHDIAYEAITKKTKPGYGWWLEQGVTTSWEYWDAPGSGNHPMFGGGIVWFYRKLAGMNADEQNPGYKHIVFRPQPAGDEKWCSYSNITPYGTAGISWKKSAESFEMDITVPVGCTATVFLPSDESKKITENGKKISVKKGIRYIKSENGYSEFKVGSGKYKFRAG